MNKTEDLIQSVCQSHFGVLHYQFLCQSVSTLQPKLPLCVPLNASIQEVVEIFQNNRTGCVVVTDTEGRLVGIFSERDIVLKVLPTKEDLSTLRVKDFMTQDPVSQTPDSTLAFVLNLMSQGGFRHMPIVDAENHPIGMLSVKDVIDYIVSSFIEDLMNMETP